MSRLGYTERWHQYTLDGKRVPSVSQIIGAINKAALPNAAAKETAIWAAANVEALDVLGTDAWVREASGAARRVWNQRADDGRRLHKIAETMISGAPMPTELDGEPVPEHVQAMATQLAYFFDAWDVEPIAVETFVYNEQYRYAGRFDLAAELGRSGSGTWLLDYKTGESGVWAESSLQLSGYGHCTHYVAHGDHDKPLTELGIERAAVVWIRPHTWELVPVRYEPDVFRTFLHAGAVAAWLKQSREVSVMEPIARPDGVSDASA